jgi:CubicO group peptidase (beta-lactamase class C family)/beta-glucosidase-like glycosyl hydrolase
MNLQEKIGQLIIWELKAPDSTMMQTVYEQIKRGRLGGVIIEGLNIKQFISSVDTCRFLAKLPMFIGTSEKVSMHNQFTGLARMPFPVTLAALDSPEIETMLESHYLKQCKTLGINLTLKPTLRIDNPNIYGFDPLIASGNWARISERAESAFLQFQDSRILTILDAYDKTALIENDTLRDSLFADYLTLTKQGLEGMLITNEVFKNDTISKLPPRYLKRYLYEKLSFHGLMVARLGNNESPAQKIFHGTDLFITEDAPRVFYSVVKLMERGKLSERDLDRKVRQILLAKSWIKGGKFPPKEIPAQSLVYPDTTSKLALQDTLLVNTNQDSISESPIIRVVTDYFTNESWDILSQRIFENSVALVNDKQSIIPASNAIGEHIFVYEYSQDSLQDFETMLGSFAPYKLTRINTGQTFSLPPVEFGQPVSQPLFLIVLDALQLDTASNRLFLDNLHKLASGFRVVLINFGDPANLSLFPEKAAAIHAFERNKYTENHIAQLIFGGASASGKLPRGLCPAYADGTAISRPAVRLGYTLPEFAGIKSSALSGIQAIAKSSISNGVFPGCQIVLVKDGRIIFSKTFGYHTYEKTRSVRKTDIYDIASITKAVVTSLAIMQMKDRGSLEIENRISNYISELKGRSNGSLTVKELLMHTSGLPPQMPLYGFLRSDAVPKRGCNTFFCRKWKESYSVRVSENVFFKQNLKDTIWNRVYRMPEPRKSRYRYSDINFFLLQKIVERLASTTLDSYAKKKIFNPLGLYYSTFNPITRFPKEAIVPTENDRKWRKNLIHGFVHDPAAALMGGVGGNAGLFSNAENIAVVFQMLLNEGSYGGQSFLNPEIVQDFITRRKSNNRGLGFDMPGNKRYPAYSRLASRATFGHTGFTGTCVWADPANQSVFVFLSNRVFPSSSNGKIFTQAIRSRMHTLFYEACNTYNFELPELEQVGEQIAVN